eukprot:49951_1
MAALQNEDDNNEESSEMGSDTNLLDLGADAWDDSALIEAFNKDLKLYQKSHSNQLIDLSKVSTMINFKKAKKINQNVKKQQREDTQSESESDDDDNDSKSNDAQIMAPSFVPFANTNATSNTNKYTSWPPPQAQSVPKTRPRQSRKGRKGKKNSTHVETENLAKMYEEQERERRKQQETQQATRYGYVTQYNNEYPRYTQPQPQPYGYYYAQPQQPPMPPYARSGMFNMGLNMMPPPAMSTKPTRDEALSNMLLAWYWNGYYAGYQAANEHNK